MIKFIIIFNYIRKLCNRYKEISITKFLFPFIVLRKKQTKKRIFFAG